MGLKQSQNYSGSENVRQPLPPAVPHGWAGVLEKCALDKKQQQHNRKAFEALFQVQLQIFQVLSHVLALFTQ